MLLTAEAERDRFTSTIAEFQEEAEVLQLLLDTLETAEGEAKTRYLAPVVSRVEPYLKMLLPGSNIVLDENLQIAALQRSGQREDFEALSGGTKEQLAVLTRLAFAGGGSRLIKNYTNGVSSLTDKIWHKMESVWLFRPVIWQPRGRAHRRRLVDEGAGRIRIRENLAAARAQRCALLTRRHSLTAVVAQYVFRTSGARA